MTTSIYTRAALTYHSQTLVARALGQTSRARVELVNSRDHKPNKEHLTHTFLSLLIAVKFCLQSLMSIGRVERYTDFVLLYRKLYVNNRATYSSVQAHLK